MVAAKVSEFVEVLSDALFLGKRHPIRIALLGAAQDAPVGVHRKRRTGVPWIALFVPGYFLR
jgi:hypothetical protein